MYRASRMSATQNSPTPAASPYGSRGNRRARPIPRLAIAAVALLLVSCRSAEPVEAGKKRTLGPDERYLVEYYMKIIAFEKHTFDDEAARNEKSRELAAEFDSVRVARAIASLEKKPERWLAIYNRINELQPGEPLPLNAPR